MGTAVLSSPPPRFSLGKWEVLGRCSPLQEERLRKGTLIAYYVGAVVERFLLSLVRLPQPVPRDLCAVLRSEGAAVSWAGESDLRLRRRPDGGRRPRLRLGLVGAAVFEHDLGSGGRDEAVALVRAR